MSIIPRSEFPNPAFERKSWMTLNGQWEFAFDNDNKFERGGKVNAVFDRKITVPFCFQSKLSGIDSDEPCENIWYKKIFEIKEEDMKSTALLRFGAVDYFAKIWLNGQYLGCHEGGFTPFFFDVTDILKAGENELIVKAEDSFSKEIPRGKQMWGREPRLCWYTNTSGIWQSVWIEFTGRSYITKAHITPDVDNNMAYFNIGINRSGNFMVSAEISRDNKVMGTITATVNEGKTAMSFTFDEYGASAVFDLQWSFEFPVLFDVKLTLFENGKAEDEVFTYFGMRKISIEGDRIYLNGQPLYQRLILDQGYWPESLMTPPSDEAIIKDIELTKSAGFNGARKHQKIEDPRYYYWADKLGLLVWAELPSAYDFTLESRRRLINDMGEFISRDYNHPCIINWVTMNESWGVHRITSNEQQKNFARAMYYFVKANDTVRTVSSNDGWEQIETNDICGIHDYEITAEDAEKKYSDVYKLINTNAQFRAIYAENERYGGEPIIVSEYGGIKLCSSGGWGYLEDAKDADDMLKRIEVITKAIRANRNICGFCYTQLTDVMIEKNGLFNDDRTEKISCDKLKKIFG